MPELRKDPIIGRWVIIATERAARPSDFKHQELISPPSKEPKNCPFCEGHEYMTPPEVLAYRHPHTKPNGPGWWVRAFPNKYPALKSDLELVKRGVGVYDMMSGFGVHEVIVETPNHKATPLTMTQKDYEEVIWAYRDRIVALSKDPRIKHVIIFKNHGRQAGASLEHPHSQLIAIPVIPRTTKNELDGARIYYELRDRCIFCDIIYQELSLQERVVFENRSFVAITPYASRFPFEIWILPKEHSHRFEEIEKNQVVDLAETLKVVLSKLYLLLNDPPYNYMLHTSPVSSNHREYYHWHIEIIPRLTHVAGFEWGTGMYINPTPPEQAAKLLREQEIP